MFVSMLVSMFVSMYVYYRDLCRLLTEFLPYFTEAILLDLVVGYLDDAKHLPNVRWIYRKVPCTHVTRCQVRKGKFMFKKLGVSTLTMNTNGSIQYVPRASRRSLDPIQGKTLYTRDLMLSYNDDTLKVQPLGTLHSFRVWWKHGPLNVSSRKLNIIGERLLLFRANLKGTSLFPLFSFIFHIAYLLLFFGLVVGVFICSSRLLSCCRVLFLCCCFFWFLLLIIIF